MNSDYIKMKNKKIVLDKTLPKLIEQKGISMKELSRLTKISSSTLYEWKNGRVPQNIQHIKLVSEILCVPIHYLLYGVGDPLENPRTSIGIEGLYEIVVKKKGEL